MLPILVSFVLLATFTHGANVGEQCDTLLECPANADCVFEYSTCSTGICECNDGFRPSDDLAVCAEEKNLGDECTSNQECEVSLVGAICGDGDPRVCECAGGLTKQYTDEATGTVYCYELDYDQQCTPLPDPSAATEQTCLTVIYGNGACQDNGGGSPVCTCADGYRIEGDVGEETICLPYQHNEDCTGESTCDSPLECLPDEQEPPVDKCLCPGELIWLNGFCVAADAPTDLSEGDPCTLTPNEEPNVGFCADGLDMCAVCQPEEDDTARCQAARGTIAIGDACELDSSTCAGGLAVCTAIYEDCTDGFCQCPDETFFLNEDCHPDLYCQETADCDLQFSDSSVSTCVTEDLLCECATEGEMLLKYENVHYCGIPADGNCAENGESEQIPDNCLAFKIDSAAATCVSGGVMRPDVCGCANGYEMVDEVCVPVVLDYMAGCLNQEEQCIGNTACVADTNDENVLKCMCEGENIQWDEEYQMCIHGGADTDLTDDDVCNTNYESPDGLLCSPWLVCDVCPGEGGLPPANNVCKRGIGVEDPIEDPPTTPPSEPDTEEPDPTEPNPTEPDGTEPADPNEPDPTEGDGAVHMHVSALLLVVAALVACIQL